MFWFSMFCLAFIGFCVFCYLDYKRNTTVYSSGSWWEVKEVNLEFGGPQFLRVLHMCNSNEFSFEYAFFEPNGDITMTHTWGNRNNGGGITVKEFEKRYKAVTDNYDKLEDAYQRRIKKDIALAMAQKTKMQAKALKAFLKK